MQPAERRVAWVFAVTALLWIVRPLLSRWVPGLSAWPTWVRNCWRCFRTIWWPSARCF
ncbi:hypothetical protein [Rhodothermus marinus]|uniref:hypothetical protein n=1 Tax=Rhodothermus marinus TaxID=29549 RepID=UPI001FB3AE91|nr:hypothetical protein [Rhodothermus marinus]